MECQTISFCQSDLLDGIDGPFHWIVANLPYIPSADLPGLQREVQFDPALALDGGQDGLTIIKRLIESIPGKIASNGLVALELGKGQAERVWNFLARQNYRDISIMRDYTESSGSSSLGMDKIIVHGGHRLAGTVKISGSKNSALPILAATLLTKDPCVIQRVPDLSDVHYMLQILAHLGADVERASGIVTVKAERVNSVAPYEIVRKMRASICVLGPLLGREKEATVSLPGGCVIGDRPIDCTFGVLKRWRRGACPWR
jgi:hypothetical protein